MSIIQEKLLVLGIPKTCCPVQFWDFFFKDKYQPRLKGNSLRSKNSAPDLRWGVLGTFVLQRGGGLSQGLGAQVLTAHFHHSWEHSGEKPERGPDGTLLIGETRWTMRKELLPLFISWPTQNISSVFSEDNTNTRIFFKLGNKSHEKDNVGWKILFSETPQVLAPSGARKGGLWLLLVTTCLYRKPVPCGPSAARSGNLRGTTQQHLPGPVHCGVFLFIPFLPSFKTC